MKQNDQKGFTLWFTGLPCSGKTTLAKALLTDLKNKGLNVEHLDGDIVREHLTKDLGFSKEDRDLNLERVTFVAKLLSRNNVGVLCTFVSPYRSVREKTRQDTTNYIEVFVDCPLEICEKRDVKGMYKKARAGEIKDFTGVDDPYELPINPEITVNTKKESIVKSKELILNKLHKLNLLNE